ncbi:unnamed protein product [Parnassius apollo]|uniref:(apollo) hypothetical protein n=1 Tax=Parnassius apollo TaxID=110799 RepID=A0A8S3VYQ3_PARAO|nr:unnamed protein product [Parnassius apollo]
MSRYKFLEELGYALVTPHVMNRRSVTNLSKELKDIIDKFLREVGVQLPDDQPAQGPAKKTKEIGLSFVPTTQKQQHSKSVLKMYEKCVP